MYLDKVRLQNVKCFADVTLQLTHAPELDSEHLDRQKNWNVILGENGEGKSTLLRAIAACLMDARTADRVVRPLGWIRTGQTEATLCAELVRHKEQDNVNAKLPRNDPHYQNEYFVVQGQTDGYGAYANDTLIDHEEVPPRANVADSATKRRLADTKFLKKTAFARDEHRGWLACGYGAFRRLPMPGRTYDDPVNHLEARFVTLFDDNAALVRCEEWLKDLDRAAAKAGDGSGECLRLKQVKARICNLLPNVTNIEIEQDVIFHFRDENRFYLSQLSDGYRSMFALIVDILRWLERAHPGTNVQVDKLSGVVLIDEIDVHLHPRWQREVGFKLTGQFPNLQFIVTTHSPFVAMAAGEGSLSVLRQDGDATRVDQDVPNPRGWLVGRVLDELFHLDSLRDPETEKDLERYQKLRLDRVAQRLSAQDAEELKQLEMKLAKIEPRASVLGSFALDLDLDVISNKLKAKRLGK